jgi:hypothetical protein
MANDLAVSVVRGYNWDNVRYYAKSLVMSGFEGKKLMFVDGVTSEARVGLQKLGFTLVDFYAEGINAINFIPQGRFVPMLEYLGEMLDSYRYAIWTDVGDVIFQTNPSTWLEQNLGTNQLAAANECWLIKDEGFNDNCTRDAMHEADYNWLRNEEAVCGGTLAGATNLFYSAFKDVYTIVRDTMIRKGRENYSPIDQAVLNYVLRRPPYKELTTVPRTAEGFTATCAVFQGNGFHSHIGFDRSKQTDKTPIFDKGSTTILTPDGSKPFSIVHQYNRDAEWKALIETKYK